MPGDTTPASAPSATERLDLRRFRPNDGPGLHAILSRPEAVRFEPYGVCDEAACERLAADRATDERFWAVCLRAGGTLIGTLYLAPVDETAWRTYELGFVFHPDHWGHGYATEAAGALLDHCFGVLRAHRVVARCDPRNAASSRLLTRLGFRLEALHRSAASFSDDEAGRPVWHDVEVHAVLAGARGDPGTARVDASGEVGHGRSIMEYSPAQPS